MARRSASRKQVDLDFLQHSTPNTNLSSMFADSVSAGQQISLIKIDKLQDNPYQPRQAIDRSGITELAQVIKSNGFQGVLVARPDPTKSGDFQITAGHRRRDAAAESGLLTLPVIVRELSDEEMIVLAIVENIQREDLTPLEEGRIFLMMDKELGFTHEQIAKEVGKTRGYIENRIRVARAPLDVQELVRDKPDSLRAVSTLIKIKDPEQRAEIIQQLRTGAITTDDMPGFIDARQPSSLNNEDDDTELSVTGDSSVEKTSATIGEPPLARSATVQLPVDPDEYALQRIGNGKLAATLRSLTSYRDSVKERGEVSTQEQINISRIRELLDEIHELVAPLDVS